MSMLSILPAVLALGPLEPSSICEQDNRQPSNFSPVGLIRPSPAKKMSGFCTVTMISDACALTAGHCVHFLDEALFSNSSAPFPSGADFNHPEAYAVDPASVRALQSRIGNDWAVVRLKPNSKTGLLPGKQHGFVEVELSDLSVPEGDLEMTSMARMPNQFPEKLTSAGQTLSFDNSILFHDLDTTAGASGALVINPKTRKAFAIHTHGGCDTMKNNKATIIARVPHLAKAIRACLASERRSSF